VLPIVAFSIERLVPPWIVLPVDLNGDHALGRLLAGEDVNRIPRISRVPTEP
jgi:hypothetical protein